MIIIYIYKIIIKLIKSNSKNLLNISSKLFSTNNHNLDESNIFSISSNFNVNKNEIEIKLTTFYCQ